MVSLAEIHLTQFVAPRDEGRKIKNDLSSVNQLLVRSWPISSYLRLRHFDVWHFIFTDPTCERTSVNSIPDTCRSFSRHDIFNHKS